MSYTQKLTALNKGLAPIYPEQDRINFAPKLAGDIRVLLSTTDGSEKYLTLNHVYSESDSSDSKVYIPALNGTVWTVSDIEGWWNLSDPDMPDIQRGFGDGSFDVTGRNQARTVNLTGSILITESSREKIAALNTAARTALINAFNLVKRGTWLIVDEDDYKRAAFVRLSGKPEITTTNSRGRIDFSIGLKAADPIKYEWYPVSNNGVIPTGFVGDGNAFRISKTTGGTSGYRNYPTSGNIGIGENNNHTVETTAYYRTYPNTLYANSSSGRLSVFNYGTTNIPCYIRFVGPLFGPAVIANSTTNQEINIIAPTTVGQQVLYPSETISTVQFLGIDTQTHEVHIGDYYNGVTSTKARGLLSPLIDWIYLAPGLNDISYEDSGAKTSAGNIEIYWQSGWDG